MDPDFRPFSVRNKKDFMKNLYDILFTVNSLMNKQVLSTIIAWY